MKMVYCRGCGKEIHETAIMCPHCGFQYKEQQKDEQKNTGLAKISSFISFILIINWFEVWHKDLRTGLWIFSILTIALSAVGLGLKHRGEIFHRISIGIAIATVVMLLRRNQ